jgi:hypothetical protein
MMQRPSWHPVLAVALVVGLLLVGFPAGAAEGGRVTPRQAEDAIRKGREVLLRSIQANQNFRGQVRGRGLTLLALLNSGIKPTDPRIDRAIANHVLSWKELMASQYAGSYQGGILLMLLAEVDDVRYRPMAAEIARRLQRFQEMTGGWGDNSRTQFALLGLKAAEDLGIDVPDSVFEAAQKYVLAGQHADGGWGYTPTDRRSYGSMTAAGITSLYICRMQLIRSSKTCGRRDRSLNLQAGLAWIANRFTVRQNPGVGRGNHFYFLYGLERVGVILARRFLGGNDWYREGAEYLINAQRPDGSWSNTYLGTEYAMLFLSKGSRRLAIQKLDYGPGWEPDPFDVMDLTKRASKDLKEPVTYQVVDQEAHVEELFAAPVLYLQGHEAFEFKASFRKTLRRYLDNGGFLFASACCGSPAFDKSFRAEMRKLYPDVEFENVPADHAIYTSPYRLTDTDAYMLETMNTGCRFSIFYAPHDVCCGWGGCQGCRDGERVTQETARQLGVNMLAFVIGLRKLRDRLDTSTVLVSPESARRLPPDTLHIGRLRHGGGCELDPAALPSLLQTLRERANMKRDATTVEVSAATDELGDYPIIYMIGFRDFQMTDREIERLRDYLDRGGFLFAECGCGRDEFNRAFRAFCKKLYPQKKEPLKLLRPEHAVFQSPHTIREVRYKKSVARRFPNLGNKPHLEGIEHNDRLAVIYSRFNLSCELQGRKDPSSLGVLNPYAYQLGVNVIVYALCR